MNQHTVTLTADTFGAPSNHPRNSWWVAAFGDEVNRTPLARWLLERPVVLFRREDGTPVALEDRCPHRWAPLSDGVLHGDEIACPYHGFRFGTDGVCTNVPSQKNVPDGTRVHSYPVIESGPFIWIWMGEPERAGESAPVELPWWQDPDWVHFCDAMQVGCNYMMIQENVLDLTHFGFLHADTLAQTGWTDGSFEVARKDGQVRYDNTFENIRLAPAQAIPTGIGTEKPVRRADWGVFYAPAIHVAGSDITDPAVADGQRNQWQGRIVHATTPIDSRSCHYWWLMARDYGTEDAAGLGMAKELVIATFQQDKDVCEAIQERIDRDGRGNDVREVSVRADRAGLYARNAVDQMVKRES